jgi:hypothetical protein
MATGTVLRELYEGESRRLSPRARVGSSIIAHFFSRRFDEAVPKLLLAIREDPSFQYQFGMDVDTGISGPSRQSGWIGKRFLGEARLPVLVTIRNRWFADSPLEGDGFEPSVPRKMGYNYKTASCASVTGSHSRK